MTKAIFLDRDGVINTERGDYTFRLEDFCINDGLIEFMQKMKKLGYIFIVVTNQGGVSRGLFTAKDVSIVHNYLIDELLIHDLELAEIYACMHHQNFTRCLCRKPESIFFEKAIARFDIDISKSIMIGDSDRDILACEKAGIKGIRVQPNEYLPENPEILNFISQVADK
jgi:D-glycero-D-manno-heptose 1,7-bisphosphate phosphatase